MSKPIQVLFLAAEAAPLIKVGGLGDVAGSLPPALRRLDPAHTGGRPIDVRLVIPFHGEIQRRLPDPEPVVDFLVERPAGSIQAKAFRTLVGDLPVYLIDGPPILPDSPVYSLDSEAD
ncbi:MAG TPA: glycogen/starch synthase, partial [Anaerolineaceae bacterium]|nr:glycogen/starch synthase [Anaerolineaceae bacterium]